MKSNNLELSCPRHPNNSIISIDPSCLDSSLLFCAECHQNSSNNTNLVSISDYISKLETLYKKAQPSTLKVSERPPEANELIEEAKKSLEILNKIYENPKVQFKHKGEEIMKDLERRSDEIVDKTNKEIDHEFSSWKNTSRLFARLVKKYNATQEDLDLYPTRDQIEAKFFQTKTAAELSELVRDLNEDLFLDPPIIKNARKSKESKKSFKKTVTTDYQEHMNVKDYINPRNLSSNPYIVSFYPDNVNRHMNENAVSENASFMLGVSTLNHDELSFLNRQIELFFIKVDYKHVFRGSRDGMELAGYLKAVKNIPNSITIIKTKFGKSFAFVLNGTWQEKSLEVDRFRLISINEKVMYEYTGKKDKKNKKESKLEMETEEEREEDVKMKIDFSNDKMSFGGDIVLKKNLGSDQNEVNLSGFSFNVERVIGGSKFQIDEIEVLHFAQIY